MASVLKKPLHILRISSCSFTNGTKVVKEVAHRGKGKYRMVAMVLVGKAIMPDAWLRAINRSSSECFKILL